MDRLRFAKSSRDKTNSTKEMHDYPGGITFQDPAGTTFAVNTVTVPTFHSHVKGYKQLYAV